MIHKRMKCPVVAASLSIGLCQSDGVGRFDVRVDRPVLGRRHQARLWRRQLAETNYCKRSRGHRRPRLEIHSELWSRKTNRAATLKPIMHAT